MGEINLLGIAISILIVVCGGTILYHTTKPHPNIKILGTETHRLDINRLGYIAKNDTVPVKYFIYSKLRNEGRLETNTDSVIIKIPELELGDTLPPNRTLPANGSKIDIVLENTLYCSFRKIKKFHHQKNIKCLLSYTFVNHKKIDDEIYLENKFEDNLSFIEKEVRPKFIKD